VSVKNKVQLITYPDSLGGDLKSLNNVLLKYFKDIFEGGIHILPPFPSSGDRGFAPLTPLEIEPAFGTWDDIRAIGQHFDVMLDLVVNHISAQSAWFRDFLKKGRDSEYAGLFITPDKIWGNGHPLQEDIDKIFLRREEPFSTFNIEKTGKPETVWTTFGKQTPSEQVDLDIRSEATKKLLAGFISGFGRQKVKMARLDAVGYVVKKPGTSCFFVEPEIYGFLSWITESARLQGMEVLPEVHSHYGIQYKLAEKGYWIYDFILPYYILETLVNHSPVRLAEYLEQRPCKQFTMLDCHDGIPVKPDLDGLVSSADARKIVDVCLQRGANLSLIFSDKHKGEDGFDVHQIRGTFYSLLGCNNDAYMAARAIQFFTPGIPQVYYVGLLAGENDTKNVERTGEGREINRHNFSLGEIDEALKKPVVQRLLRLIRFRNQYPAFDGKFSVKTVEKGKIALEWDKGNSMCLLDTDLNTFSSTIFYKDGDGATIKFDV
jgi:sucrose 6(F)-phosphate phosphorylase